MPRLVSSAVPVLLLVLFGAGAAAQDGKTRVTAYIDQRASTFGDLAQEIWDLAEVGYRETQSSALLAGVLRASGFEVEMGVAGIPTAFVARWRSGEGPILGLLAEYDALPGISQDRSPVRAPIEDKSAGHACGHHLFGAGTVAAALATRDWMQASGVRGEIRVYGTPAEEGGSGKVYLVRAGLFDDVDIVLHWHPSGENDAGAISSLANKSARFRFHGLASHAAIAPEDGRSALDGVEAMDHMVNLMREHLPQETRVHYVITRGGAAPNVVPDFAEVFYYVRHPDPDTVHEIFDRIALAAEGAALGTGTTMDFEVEGGVYNVLPNAALQQALDANLRAVGGVHYDETERTFAEALRTTLPGTPPPVDASGTIEPFAVSDAAGFFSTDVADVSWQVPTGGVTTATWVPGTSAHSWQAIAAGGMSIGNKGMVVAAKTLAMTAVDIFTRPALVQRARDELVERIPDGWTYRPLLGDRDPPLGYRAGQGPKR